MKIQYDPKAKAVYVELKNPGTTEVDHTIEINEGIFVDYDTERNVLGYEFLDVKTFELEVLMGDPKYNV